MQRWVTRTTADLPRFRRIIRCVGGQPRAVTDDLPSLALEIGTERFFPALFCMHPVSSTSWPWELLFFAAKDKATEAQPALATSPALKADVKFPVTLDDAACVELGCRLEAALSRVRCTA